MHKVTDEQVDFILDDIAKKGIATEDVRYNILDHVCCIIENEMPVGTNFVEFYKNTIARFYRNELREIEEETKQLITFKYYRAMRRTLKITGGITVALCLLGTLFKFQHWPGAGVLLLLSLGFFGLVFIPLNIVMKFRDETEPTNRFIITFGFILGSIITIGFLFKIFHWPGANMMILGSLGLFGIIFIPVYFITRYRNLETRFNSIVHTTFMVAGTGLIFSLVNLKPSKDVMESVESKAQFQEENLSQFQDQNDDLFQALPENDNQLIQLREATKTVMQTIDGVRLNLISKSENVSLEEAEKIDFDELSNPNDTRVVHNHFTHSKSEYSYDAFAQAIDAYNDLIIKYDILRIVDISKLQLERTMLSVILMDLTDVEIQILSNENSYLCYQKGIMASK